jgi:starch phosphorylase
VGPQPVQQPAAPPSELIYEINRRFLQQVRLRYPGNDAIQRKLSIIDEEGSKAVRMAHLATIGAHHVNGVAALHSDLVKTDLLPEFAALWPEKFTNVTNGVTPRRWVALANPEMSPCWMSTLGPTGSPTWRACASWRSGRTTRASSSSGATPSCR